MNGILWLFNLFHRYMKFRIRKPIAKRIGYFISSTRNGFEVPITNIDIFCVIHIGCRLMKSSCWRIIFQFFGKGIHQLTGRIHISAKDICHGKTTFHTALQRKQSSLNIGSVLEPDSIHHTSHVQNYNYLLKVFCNYFHHVLFGFRQIVVAVFKDTVW